MLSNKLNFCLFLRKACQEHAQNANESNATIDVIFLCAADDELKHNIEPLVIDGTNIVNSSLGCCNNAIYGSDWNAYIVRPASFLTTKTNEKIR